MTAPTRPRSEIDIAGVPWPVYKLVALAIGVLVFVVVGVSPAAVGSAVVAAAAATTLVWLGLGLFHNRGA
jgi:Flp pilus assembly protein TadB